MGNFTLFHCQSMGVTLRLRAWSCQLDWKNLKPQNSDCSRMQGVMSCLCVRTATELKELPFHFYDHHCHQYLPSSWKVWRALPIDTVATAAVFARKSSKFHARTCGARRKRRSRFSVNHRIVSLWLGILEKTGSLGVIEWSVRIVTESHGDHVPSVECDTFDTLESKEIWKRRQKASGPRHVAWQKTIPRVPRVPSRRSDTTWQNSTSPGAMRPRMRPTSLTPLSLDLSDLRMPQNRSKSSISHEILMTHQPNNPSMDRFMMFHVKKMFLGFWLKSMKSSWNPPKVDDFIWFQHFTHHFAPRSLEGGLTRGLIWPPGATHQMGWSHLLVFDRFGLIQYNIITHMCIYIYIIYTYNLFYRTH